MLAGIAGPMFLGRRKRLAYLRRIDDGVGWRGPVHEQQASPQRNLTNGERLG
jgi:hypothetical protein